MSQDEEEISFSEFLQIIAAAKKRSDERYLAFRRTLMPLGQPNAKRAPPSPKE